FLIAGYSEFALRFFSIFFGTATIALAWAIGKRMFDARVGLLSAFFVTIAPFAVQYSQEIRMYALAMFLTALGLYLFARLSVIASKAKQSPSRELEIASGKNRPRNDKWTWLAYALTMLLALYTLYHTALLFLATGLALLPQFKARRAFVVRWFAVAFGVGAIFLPWLLFKYVSAAAGIKDVAGDTQPMDLATFLARGFAAISVGTTIPLNNAFILAGLYAALIAIALLIALATRAAKMYDALLLLLSTIPILAYYPLYLAMPLYRGRLFALACVPLMLLLARSTTLIVQRARLAAIPIALLIVGTSAYSVGNYFTNYNRYSAVVEDYLPAIHEI
ncbi:MAG: glycosyltransferase family 39 protein, partial [Anaerolineales bacterium]|nr:glycosyltransferase family 39 protein [Anaerolineales bacterium]